MALALREARRGIGLTSPNPPVGAVIVRDGEILGKGWHRKAGGPHAERSALANAGGPQACHGATMYVTLEPCSTHGRTPPCVEALIEARLKRVVWAVDDPHHVNAGRAEAVLTGHGISVSRGIMAAEAAHLLEPWTKFITTGVPWVIAKAGLSLDGKITRPRGEGPWLTNDLARADAMKLRRRVDAIVVGAETIRRDDPSLTLRPPRPGKDQPWRVVLTRSGRLPETSRVFTDAWKDRTLVLTHKTLEAALRDLAERRRQCAHRRRRNRAGPGVFPSARRRSLLLLRARSSAAPAARSSIPRSSPAGRSPSTACSGRPSATTSASLAVCAVDLASTKQMDSSTPRASAASCPCDSLRPTSRYQSDEDSLDGLSLHRPAVRKPAVSRQSQPPANRPTAMLTRGSHCRSAMETDFGSHCGPLREAATRPALGPHAYGIVGEPIGFVIIESISTAIGSLRSNRSPRQETRDFRRARTRHCDREHPLARATKISVASAVSSQWRASWANGSVLMPARRLVISPAANSRANPAA